MNTPSWAEYTKNTANPQPQVNPNQPMIIKNEKDEIVGVKTNRPYPVSFLRIVTYSTSMNMNRPTVYAFDERGETWASSENLKDILVGIETWINNTQTKG